MSDDCTRLIAGSKRSYRWFYDQVQSRYYDLLIQWCFLPFGGESRIRQQLLAPIVFGPAEIILDVGCGTGSATFAIAAKAGPQARIVGLDLSLAWIPTGPFRPNKDGG